MAKYRGKHEGKTRGKYVRRALVSEQSSRKENYKIAARVNGFIGDKGFGPGFAEYTFNDGPFYEKLHIQEQAYHIAGATVVIKKSDYEKPTRDFTGRKHATGIRLISNDSLDDIIEMILDRCPSFKEIDYNRSR